MARVETTAVDHVVTPNETANIAKAMATALKSIGFDVRGIDNMGTSARLIVRSGSRRQPGDLQGVDTVREFSINVAETPREQIRG